MCDFEVVILLKIIHRGSWLKNHALFGLIAVIDVLQSHIATAWQTPTSSMHNVTLRDMLYIRKQAHRRGISLPRLTNHIIARFSVTHGVLRQSLDEQPRLFQAELSARKVHLVCRRDSSIRHLFHSQDAKMVKHWIWSWLKPKEYNLSWGE